MRLISRRVQGCEQLLAEVVDRSGQCDILINGAGINAPTPFLEIPEDEYDRIFAINTKAVFLACQVFGKYFLDNGITASIINMGSMSGVIGLVAGIHLFHDQGCGTQHFAEPRP